MAFQSPMKSPFTPTCEGSQRLATSTIWVSENGAIPKNDANLTRKMMMKHCTKPSDQLWQEEGILGGRLDVAAPGSGRLGRKAVPASSSQIVGQPRLRDLAYQLWFRVFSLHICFTLYVTSKKRCPSIGLLMTLIAVGQFLNHPMGIMII